MKQVDQILEQQGQVHIAVAGRTYMAYTIRDFVQKKHKLGHEITSAEYVRQCCRQHIEKTGKRATLPDGWDCAKHKGTGRIYIYYVRIESAAFIKQTIDTKKTLQKLNTRYQERGYDNSEQEAEALISCLPVTRVLALEIVDAVEGAIKESELPRQTNWKKELIDEQKLIGPYIEFLKNHQHDEYDSIILEDITGTPLIRILKKRFELVKDAIERMKPDKTLWWQKLMVFDIKQILERSNVQFSKRYKKGDPGFQLLMKVLKVLEHYPWPSNREIQLYHLVKDLYSVSAQENNPAK